MRVFCSSRVINRCMVMLNKEGIMIKGTFFRNFKGRKIVRIEMNGELFSVRFSDGEILTKLTITELNHVITTATGR